ncbi:hypothetical protein A9Q84_10775 [Halobacteriovorax marinus]|uniref:Solute-binding protein family 3/N-terminal domain-containing protein n=1 Tax=Halobacteriovorax marinus TaxID=97084 RepID=A0A1Y5F7U5_9BACT|nr:hypothetical protein A9Q84_10775 [Halobacteriovorax marinus]
MKYLFLIFILCFQNIFAKELILASTKSMPPYLYHNEETGIEYEIVNEALKAAGFKKIRRIDVHFRRGIILLNMKEIDAITSNMANNLYDQVKHPIYSSNLTLNYIDCAISLKENNFQLNNIKNFYNKRIWAFKSASKIFGPKFEEMTKENKGYTESFDQKRQVKVLLRKRIDIAISDKNIFLSRLKLESSKKDGKKLFNFHSIGKPTKRSVRFLDKKIRDDFNKGLKTIKNNGKYKEILKKYKDLYSQEC